RRARCSSLPVLCLRRTRAAEVAWVRVGMFRNRLLAVVVLVSMVMTFMPLGQPAAAVSTTVVISQVYGGGGNSGATFKNDFIELFNRGAASVNLTGWSVQYASSAGTTWATTSLLGAIQPGQYYLVQEAQGAGG